MGDPCEEICPDGLAHDLVFLADDGQIEFDGRREADGANKAVGDPVEDSQRVRDPVDHAEPRMGKGKAGEKTSEHEPGKIFVASRVQGRHQMTTDQLNGFESEVLAEPGRVL